jgi:hypothetical protein
MIRITFTRIFLLLSFIVSIVSQSCVNHDIAKQEPNLCESDTTISFNDHIKPIITSNCAIQGTGDNKCHNGDNGADINWTVLSNFQQHSHEVKRRINLPKSNGDHMPREGELTGNQIQIITCWVEQGALDN